MGVTATRQTIWIVENGSGKTEWKDQALQAEDSTSTLSNCNSNRHWKEGITKEGVCKAVIFEVAIDQYSIIILHTAAVQLYKVFMLYIGDHS